MFIRVPLVPPRIEEVGPHRVSGSILLVRRIPISICVDCEVGGLLLNSIPNADVFVLPRRHDSSFIGSLARI